MKVKSLGANKTELELKDLQLLISYSTPVALIRIKQARAFGTSQRTMIKTSKFHSITTSKHINQWFRDNGIDLDKYNIPTMDQEFFDQFLEDNN